MASLIGGVEDLVVEDREVEGQAQTDGVGRSKVGGSNLSSGLVGLERSIGSTLAVVANGKLSKVTVVVTLPVGVRKGRLEPRITLGGIVLSKDCLKKSARKLTSCGRRPWTRRSGQRGSSACREPLGCPRRSWRVRPRSFGGTP